jgi:AcrR family transcriptional regulator
MSVAEPAPGLRARVRQEMRGEILAAARRQLAEEGPGGVSLRAVARDVGLVSSAVYRYFASRDALLTELILESYNRLGDAVEVAEAEVPRERLGDRYRAVGRATREWAVAEPQQWALIYGSPVPGYQAPQETIAPAIRTPLLLSRILWDAVRTGRVPHTTGVPERLHAALLLRSVLPDPEGVPDDLLVRGLAAWTYILGSVSSQLFGQRHNVIAEDAYAAVYELELDRMVEFVGFE